MKKNFISAILAAALTLGSNAFASGGIDYKLLVNQESRVVSVEVTIDGNEGGTTATGLVVNGEGNIVYTAQGYTNEDGKFDFSYINNDENGNYIITVAAPRIGLCESTSFKMMTGSMKAAIGGMDKNDSNLKSVVETYGEYMNLDMTAFSSLTNGDAVYSFMANDSMVSMNDVASIVDGFYGAVIIKTLAEGGDIADYMDFLNSDTYSILNKDKIPTGENESLFDELSSDIKSGVMAKVLSEDYQSAEELSDRLGFYVLEESLAKALQWTEIHSVMLKYKEAGLLNIDFSTYNSLKKPQLVDNAMIRGFENYSEIEKTFNDAVAKALASQKEPSNSGGGSGGGGGGKVIPSVKVPEPVEKPDQEVPPIFTDMEDYMWANEAVTYLADKGIISGIGDGLFAPANGLTREEVSTIIVKTQKLSIEGKSSIFNDVSEGHWSYPYVSAVNEAGLMVGVSNDMFGATSKITRNEFAAIMRRLIDLYDVKLTVNTSTDEYDDAENIPQWAKESVMYMKGTGLMLGSTGNSFNGDEVVSRAYACDILYAVLNAVNYDAEV